MRASTAYFAGVGTVAFAIAAGLGGGYLAANIVSPHEPRYGTETSRIERRMASQPIPVTTAPSEPVPYIQATAVTAPVVQPQHADPAVLPPPAPAEGKTASPALTAQPAVANTSPSRTAPANVAPQVEQAAEKSAASQEAFAKAREADVRRAAVEKRRAERRQHWAEKRRVRQPREQELDAVEEKVREVTEPRRAFAAEPARIESPRIRLFDLD